MAAKAKLPNISVLRGADIGWYNISNRLSWWDHSHFLFENRP
ncbi:hypothetical protein ES707_03898 [subsurface metagenome]